MGGIFDLNNKFFQFMGKVADCMILNILWILSSLPLFTIGASTTALYYTVVKVIRHDIGNVGREYWHSFRDNFKQATLIWFLIFLLCGILVIDCIILYTFLEAASIMKWLLIASLFVMACIVIWAQYCFSYLARFSDTGKTILKNSLYIALSNLERSIWILAIFIGSIWILLSPLGLLLLLFFPTVGMLANSIILEKIYQKYLPTNEDQKTNEEV